MNFNASPLITDNSYSSNNDAITVIISHIKQDVIVTGTTNGTPGEESALFQIEGMADKSFNLNAQLMCSFIITDITKSGYFEKSYG